MNLDIYANDSRSSGDVSFVWSSIEEHGSVLMAEARLGIYQQGVRNQRRVNLHNNVAWKRSIYGIRIGGVIMKSRKWPRSRSELQRDSSIILTTNSRAGWEIAWLPSPRPYQRPVHHARFVSSCLNSRDKHTEIKTLWMARWMAITVMSPKTACDASHNSRNH